jgi:hypothetical protein
MFHASPLLTGPPQRHTQKNSIWSGCHARLPVTRMRQVSGLEIGSHNSFIPPEIDFSLSEFS